MTELTSYHIIFALVGAIVIFLVGLNIGFVLGRNSKDDGKKRN